ncbi:hypothetical protein, partial [Thiolapillus sp.]|uniref:hypothetical protein n=1 Tax=Thiolapillus sp. TaxID=2017437 RepID=UPI003AF6564B
MRQLHIQQPIVQIFWLMTRPIKQEFLFGLLAEHAILQRHFVIGKLDLFYFRQFQCVEIAKQFLLGVVPKDNAMALEEFGQGLGDA